MFSVFCGCAAPCACAPVQLAGGGGWGGKPLSSHTGGRKPLVSHTGGGEAAELTHRGRGSRWSHTQGAGKPLSSHTGGGERWAHTGGGRALGR